MLKLRRGWAAARAAPTRTASPTAVETARALTGPGSRSPPGRAEPLERPGGGLRVQDMEVRVQRQRPGDVPSRAVGIAARLVDESRMEVQARVGRAEPQSLLDRGLRFHEPAVAVEGPREDVLSVDVAPHVQLLAGEMQGLDRFHVVIGVEECQLPVIDRLVEGVQRADVFDERILPTRLVALAQLRLDITEGGGVLRQRDDRQRLPVGVDGVPVPVLAAADARQAGERAVVAGIRRERGTVRRVRLGRPSDRKRRLAELRLTPRERLGAGGIVAGGLDGPPHAGERRLGVALQESQVRETAVRVPRSGEPEQPRVRSARAVIVAQLHQGIAGDGVRGDVGAAELHRLLSLAERLLELVPGVMDEGEERGRGGGGGALRHQLRGPPGGLLGERVVGEVAALASLLDVDRAELVVAEDVLGISRDAGLKELDELIGRLGLGGERARRERSEEHTSELQSQSNLVCRLLLEKKKKRYIYIVPDV